MEMQPESLTDHQVQDYMAWCEDVQSRVRRLHRRCDFVERIFRQRGWVRSNFTAVASQSTAGAIQESQTLHYEDGLPDDIREHMKQGDVDFTTEFGLIQHEGDKFAIMPETGRMYKFLSSDPWGHRAFKSEFGLEHRVLGVPGDIEKSVYRNRHCPYEKHKRADVKRYEALDRDPEIRAAVAKTRRIRLKDVEGLKVMTPLYWKLLYILLPPFLGAFSLALQNVCLHINTAHYIQYMRAVDQAMNSTRSAENEPHGVPEGVKKLWQRNTDRVAEGRLWDALDDSIDIRFPNTNRFLKISFTDAIAALPGGMFCFAGFPMQLMLRNGEMHIGIWTKTFLVYFVMNVGKGLFDMATMVPDSAGWDACQKRLKSTGIAAIESGKIGGSITSISDLIAAFVVEVLGYGAGGTTREHVRFCSDMLSSGHTCLAVVFALGFFKMLQNYLNYMGAAKHCQWILLDAMKLILTFCVLVDVSVIGVTRFHYTVDVALAVILAVLWFDSIHLETIVSIWTRGYHWHNQRTRPLEEAGRKIVREISEPQARLQIAHLEERYAANMEMLMQYNSGKSDRYPVCDSGPADLLNLAEITKLEGTATVDEESGRSLSTQCGSSSIRIRSR